jgi:hypothetical protein
MTFPTALVDLAWTVVVPLLDDVPKPDEVRPGGLAMVLMVALIVATVLLWMSMRKQLRKVTFDENAADDPAARDDAEQPGDEDDDSGRR